MFGGISHKLSMLRKKISEDLGYQGPNNPASASDGGNGDFGWANTNNALTSNNTYASATSTTQYGSFYSNYLFIKDFGFSIPKSSTIDGIEVNVEAYASRNNKIITYSPLYLVKKTSTGYFVYNYYSSNLSGLSVTTTEQNLVLGGPTDIWYDAGNEEVYGPLTPSIINDPDFGVALQFAHTEAEIDTIYVDNATMKIYYTVDNSLDLIPNSVNWADISDGMVGFTNTQTISGINNPITLKLEWNVTGGNPASIYMYVNGNERTVYDGVVDNNSLQSVKNGDQIYFIFVSTISQGTFTVKNASDNDTVLDTFTWFLLD